MLTLNKSDKKKVNPWKPVLWCLENPYWFWVFLTAFGGAPTFLLAFIPGGVGVFFGIITFIFWCAAIILILGGAFVWLIEGGFDDVYRWVRKRAENYGKVED